MDTFNYQDFFHSIKNRVSQAKINFSRQANREANSLYWFIGKMIIENQKKQGWGKSIVENLSKDLKVSFPDIKFGFSPQNLWHMRQFFLEYKDFPNLQQLVRELSWGANLLILYKIKDLKAREYYLRATTEMG
jgi:predicted nuclease of restriction endonuclease-like (RecB) superfamily